MTALLVDDLAQLIRRVDGDNRLHPADLASDIAAFLMPRLPLDSVLAKQEEIKDLVFYRNRDKHLAAGRLAELIVAEFRLDEEDR